MPVINQKERSNAKWRFAGLYLFSLALPALLLFNTLNMNKVECEDTSQLVEQLRKRDKALADLSQLAITLYNMQQLKPASDKDPEPQNKAKYDQLEYEFINGVKNLKQLYFSDTTLYSSNYKIVEALDYNYKIYDETPAIIAGKAPITPGGPKPNDDYKTQVFILTKEVKELEKTIKGLEGEVNTYKTEIFQKDQKLQDFASKARIMETNIGGISTLLNSVEEEANKIEKKGDRNLVCKKNILERIKSMKDDIRNVKNSNDILLTMFNH